MNPKMTTKSCPICLEIISTKSSKCPHCHEWLTWLTWKWLFRPSLVLFAILNLFVGLPGWIYGLIQSNEKNAALNFKPVLESAIDNASNGNIAQAIPMYKKALEIEPDNSDALQLLGYAEYIKWNENKSNIVLLDRALKNLEKAVEVNPRNKWAHYNYAIVLWNSGGPIRQAAALKQVVELLKLDPSFKYKIQKDRQFNSFSSSGEFMSMIWGASKK